MVLMKDSPISRGSKRGPKKRLPVGMVGTMVGMTDDTKACLDAYCEQHCLTYAQAARDGLMLLMHERVVLVYVPERWDFRTMIELTPDQRGELERFCKFHEIPLSEAIRLGLSLLFDKEIDKEKGKKSGRRKPS